MIVTRTASARQRRIDEFLLRADRIVPQIVQCPCCLRYRGGHVMSARGWCSECEAQFRRIFRSRA